MRAKHSHDTGHWQSGHPQQSPDLSDRAFRILVAAALALAVVVAVLILALYP
jgi:hypothetical protein